MYACKGYDVWLANNRGNKYSNHGLGPKKWDFTFEEMAQYDLPAEVEHILKESNKEKLTYIGHS